MTVSVIRNLKFVQKTGLRSVRAYRAMIKGQDLKTVIKDGSQGFCSKMASHDLFSD